MLMPFSKKDFLKVSAHVSLKVATKYSFRGKNIQKFSTFTAYILKQKWSSATKRVKVSLTNLEC